MGAGIVVTQGSTAVNATLDLSPSLERVHGQRQFAHVHDNRYRADRHRSFAVTVYNQAPVNNAIPSGAAILGVGTSSVNVVAGSTTSVQVFIGGQIAHFGAALPVGRDAGQRPRAKRGARDRADRFR